MLFSIKKYLEKSIKALFSAVIVFMLVLAQPLAYARQTWVSPMPQPGTPVMVSSAFVPPLLRGLLIHPDNPLQLDFIVDAGNPENGVQVINEQSERLVKYFMASVTTPEGDFWVNLSPKEADRIIPEHLGKTELGRDLLAQDYLLKQVAASLTYPESSLGKEFWRKVYAQAADRLKISDAITEMFSKVWIVADRAEVFEKDGSVYVNKAHLKVMLDVDSQNKLGIGSPVENEIGNDHARQVFRDLILPVLEKDVNEGKNFAVLRQIFYAAVLAKWYRDQMAETLLGKNYSGKNKVRGIDTGDVEAKARVYNQYMEAYHKGVFDYIKEDVDPATERLLPQRYFSGGITQLLPQAGHIDQGKTIAPLQGQGYSLPVRLDAAQKGQGIAEQGQSLTERLVERMSRWYARVTLMQRVLIVSTILGLSSLVVMNGDKANEQINQNITQALIALSDPQTHLIPSHVNMPGMDSVAFTYDQAIAAMAFHSAGRTKEARKILDVYADHLKNQKEITKVFDRDALGLVSDIDYKTRQSLEPYLTPGPNAIMALAFLQVDRERYQPYALMLGRLLLKMQRPDGGVVDGQYNPNVVPTEAHMDAFAVFEALYELTKDSQWQGAAEKAWQFFNTNIYDGNEAIKRGVSGASDDNIFMVDTYSWTVAGPAGDRLSFTQTARLMDKVIRKAVTRVEVNLPDGNTRWLTLIDFTDPQDGPAMGERQGFHPMGSIEVTAGVVLSLQKTAVKARQEGDSQKAGEYKALAEYFLDQINQAFYSLADGKGQISFYATGQDVVGHSSVKTPYFKNEKGQEVRGGSIVSSWILLPMNGLNLFVLDDNYYKIYKAISVSASQQEKVKSQINKAVEGRQFSEVTGEEVVNKEFNQNLIFRDLWPLGEREAFVDARMGVQSQVLVFKQPIPLLKGQQLRLKYSLKGSDVIGVSFIREWENVDHAGVRILKREVSGNNRELLLEIPETMNVHRIILNHGPNAWGHLGGSMGSTLNVWSLKLQSKPVESNKKSSQVLKGRDIWRGRGPQEYVNMNEASKAVYMDFEKPIFVESGQKVVVEYSLSGSEVLGVRFKGKGESDDSKGHLIVLRSSPGKRTQAEFTIPQGAGGEKIQLAFHLGKNAWGFLGGSVNATLDVHSVLLVDKAQAVDSALDKAPGGVDLNQILLNTVTGNGKALVFDETAVYAMMRNSFEGFVPVLMTMVPVRSVESLLSP